MCRETRESFHYLEPREQTDSAEHLHISETFIHIQRSHKCYRRYYKESQPQRNYSKRNKYDCAFKNTDIFYLLGYQQGASRERPWFPNVGKKFRKKCWPTEWIRSEERMSVEVENMSQQICTAKLQYAISCWRQISRVTQTYNMYETVHVNLFIT